MEETNPKPCNLNEEKTKDGLEKKWRFNTTQDVVFVRRITQRLTRMKTLRCQITPHLGRSIQYAEWKPTEVLSFVRTQRARVTYFIVWLVAFDLLMQSQFAEHSLSQLPCNLSPTTFRVMAPPDDMVDENYVRDQQSISKLVLRWNPISLNKQRKKNWDKIYRVISSIK